MITASAFLEGARPYLDLGYRVVPLRPGGKKPLIDDWVVRGSRDPDQIAEWARQFPGCNTGIVADRTFCVFDLDPRNNGNDSLRRLLDAHGPLPPGPRSRSAGGGFHGYFGVDESRELDLKSHFQRGDETLEGLDLLGYGRQCVEAPSIIDGRPYLWLVPLVPIAELPPAPDFFYREIVDAAPIPSPIVVPSASHRPINHTDHIDFDQVNRAAISALPSLLQQWLPGGRVMAHEYVVRILFGLIGIRGHSEINMRSGKWADFAIDMKGGDPVSLAAYLFSISQVEAARQLAELVGAN